MEKFYDFDCSRYKWKISYTWQHHCDNINSDWRYCKNNKVDPFGWRGKIPPEKTWWLPYYHPYWHIVVCFEQYRRIPKIEEAIRQTEAVIENTTDSYKKGGAMCMVMNYKDSIKYIKEHFKLTIRKVDE